MSMTAQDERHIRRQLSQQGGFDLLDAGEQYSRCYEVYNNLASDPTQWKLVEMIESETWKRGWVWVRLS